MNHFTTANIIDVGGRYPSFAAPRMNLSSNSSCVPVSTRPYSSKRRSLRQAPPMSGMSRNAPPVPAPSKYEPRQRMPQRYAPSEHVLSKRVPAPVPAYENPASSLSRVPSAVPAFSSDASRRMSSEVPEYYPRPSSPAPSIQKVNFPGLEHQPPIPRENYWEAMFGHDQGRGHSRRQSYGQRYESERYESRRQYGQREQAHGHRSRCHQSQRYREPMFPASQSSRGDHDIIDSLDHSAYYMYHHEGPFDAASRARNKVSDGGPLEALAGQHNVSPKPPRRDNNPDNRFAKQFHLPPGTVDREGRVHDDDDDGSNMMYDIMKHPGYRHVDADFIGDPFYEDPYPQAINSVRESLAEFADHFKFKSRRRRARGDGANPQ